MNAAASPSAAGSTAPIWLRSAEKGSVWGIRILVWLAAAAGRRPAGWLLRVIALYYAVVHRDVRRASKRWLELATDRPATFGDVYQHVFCFAQVALDRLFFVSGKASGCVFNYNGHEHLRELAASGKGAVLLSSHLGSQAAMSAEGHDLRLRINIVGYFKNAAMINGILSAINPESGARVVHVEPGSPGSVLDIRERVERGEMVTIACDRVGLGGRTVMADFLGRPAPFPLAPFVLASILKRPVCLVFAIYKGPNRYDLYCEPFADSLAVPRKQRQEALAAHIQRYAERLEHHARLSPQNWFNFFDFHDPHGAGESLPGDTQADGAAIGPGATP